MKAPKELGLQPNELLKLLKTFYGRSEKDHYWEHKFGKQIIDELELKNYISNTALFYKSSGEGLIGVCTPYADDALYTGSEDSENIPRKHKRSSITKKEQGYLQFSELEIETKERIFFVHEQSYIRKLKQLHKNAQFIQLQSLRAISSLTTNSRPDILCAMDPVAQVTKEKFQKDPAKYIETTNNVLKYFHEHSAFYL